MGDVTVDTLADMHVQMSQATPSQRRFSPMHNASIGVSSIFCFNDNAQASKHQQHALAAHARLAKEHLQRQESIDGSLSPAKSPRRSIQDIAMIAADKISSLRSKVVPIQVDGSSMPAGSPTRKTKNGTVSRLYQPDPSGLSVVFSTVAHAHQDTISHADLHDTLIHSNAGLSRSELAHLSQALDTDGTGRLDPRCLESHLSNLVSHWVDDKDGDARESSGHSHDHHHHQTAPASPSKSAGLRVRERDALASHARKALEHTTHCDPSLCLRRRLRIPSACSCKVGWGR